MSFTINLIHQTPSVQDFFCHFQSEAVDADFDAASAKQYLELHRPKLLSSDFLAGVFNCIAKQKTQDARSVVLEQVMRLTKRILHISGDIQLSRPEASAIAKLAGSILFCKLCSNEDKYELLQHHVRGDSIFSRTCDLLLFGKLPSNKLQKLIAVIEQGPLERAFLKLEEAAGKPVPQFMDLETLTPLETLCNLPGSAHEHDDLKKSLLDRLIENNVVFIDQPQEALSMERLVMWAVGRKQWKTVAFLLQDQRISLDAAMDANDEALTLRLALLARPEAKEILSSLDKLVPEPDSWNQSLDSHGGVTAYEGYLRACWYAASNGDRDKWRTIRYGILKQKPKTWIIRSLTSYEAVKNEIEGLTGNESHETRIRDFRTWLSEQANFSLCEFQKEIAANPYVLRSDYIEPYLESALMPIFEDFARILKEKANDGFQLSGGTLLTPMLLDLYRVSQALQENNPNLAELEVALEDVVQSALLVREKVMDKQFTFYGNKHFKSPEQAENFSQKKGAAAQYHTRNQSIVCQWELEASLLGLPVKGSAVYKCQTEVGADMGQKTPYIRLDSIGVSGEHSHPINYSMKGLSYNYKEQVIDTMDSEQSSRVLRYFQMLSIRDALQDHERLTLLDNSGDSEVDLGNLPCLQDLLQIVQALDPESVPESIPEEHLW